MRTQLERIRAGDELSGRKIKNFAAALSGDTQAVVVDIWLLRAFDMDRKYLRKENQQMRSGGASDKQYTEIETYIKEKAFAKGLEPRQLSAIIWAGVRIFQTGDHNTKYLEILKHQLYNMYEDSN